MKLTAIRHLPTEWNESGLLQGSRDIPIISSVSDEMMMKIGKNKEQLALGAPYDMILTSGLVRTQQTAELHGFTDYKAEPLLNELDFGELEGKHKDLLLERWGHEWRNEPHTLTFGERMTDMEKRIRTFLEHYQKYENILMFGHGTWLRALRALYETGEIKSMNQQMVANCDLLTFDLQDSKITS
ncbi:phosphoglycerate mutase family protein [Bacillus tianshenii]|nr:phosphoglycerate mutase family protein [Bacillus tianshenii]